MLVPLHRIDALRRLPWVDSVVLGRDDNVGMGDVTPWGVDSIDADLVWTQLSNRGTGVRVAVLDNGVDCAHPDLSARLKGGYDFVLSSPNYCVDGVHGTAAAGIIAASQQGTGVIGVAPEVDLYALRAGFWDGSVTRYDDVPIALGLQWAIDHQMQVVSMSIGNCGQELGPDVSGKLTDAYNAGIVLVAATGNGTQMGCASGSPVSGIARHPGVIAVSAIKEDGSRPSGYQSGPEIDLAAPTQVLTDSVGGGTRVFGGTSAAVPHVSGVAALLLHQGFTTPDLIHQRLTETARDRGAPGRDNDFGYGSVRARLAVVPVPRTTGIQGAVSPILQPGTYSLWAGWSDGIGPMDFRWDVHYSDGVLPDVHTDFSPYVYDLQVPPGVYYSITVTATPRERAYLRVGYPRTTEFDVCSGVSPAAPNQGGTVHPDGHLRCPPLDP